MLLQDKKGVSIMIGYVLLVTFALVMGVIVYQWIKTYVPADALECPEGVSMFLKGYSYNNSRLSIELKNNGLFKIEGYLIHGTNRSDQEVATIDLSEYTSLGEGKGGTVLFNTNPLEPNEEETYAFDLSATNFGQIYAIEIIPIRFQEEKNKIRFVSCGNAKIREEIN